MLRQRVQRAVWPLQFHYNAYEERVQSAFPDSIRHTILNQAEK